MGILLYRTNFRNRFSEQRTILRLISEIADFESQKGNVLCGRDDHGMVVGLQNLGKMRRYRVFVHRDGIELK